jgi:hypothetical protein
MGMNSITTAKGTCSFYDLGQTSLIQLAFTALYLLLPRIMWWRVFLKSTFVIKIYTPFFFHWTNDCGGTCGSSSSSQSASFWMLDLSKSNDVFSSTVLLSRSWSLYLFPCEYTLELNHVHCLVRPLVGGAPLSKSRHCYSSWNWLPLRNPVTSAVLLLDLMSKNLAPLSKWLATAVMLSKDASKQFEQALSFWR